MQDAEIVRLCEFKTKCIRQFISNMKKWLNNWELKQEFLVNLRNEFLVENENYHKLEDELEEVMDRERLEVENCLKELKKTYTKLEENYKLGNSFY
jgi:predicted nuclease with TOPRIM domain